MRAIAEGLLFPEGHVVMKDGSIALVEMRRGTVSQVAPNGKVSVISSVGDGPNSLAVGPDGVHFMSATMAASSGQTIFRC
jgi:gluconolactonase